MFAKQRIRIRPVSNDIDMGEVHAQLFGKRNCFCLPHGCPTQNVPADVLPFQDIRIGQDKAAYPRLCQLDSYSTTDRPAANDEDGLLPELRGTRIVTSPMYPIRVGTIN